MISPRLDNYPLRETVFSPRAETGERATSPLLSPSQVAVDCFEDSASPKSAKAQQNAEIRKKYPVPGARMAAWKLRVWDRQGKREQAASTVSTVSESSATTKAQQTDTKRKFRVPGARMAAWKMRLWDRQRQREQAELATAKTTESVEDKATSKPEIERRKFRVLGSRLAAWKIRVWNRQELAQRAQS